MDEFRVRSAASTDLGVCLSLLNQLGPDYSLSGSDPSVLAIFQEYVVGKDKLGFCAVTDEDRVVGCLFVGLYRQLCRGIVRAQGEGHADAPDALGLEVAQMLLAQGARALIDVH